jgi:hypothetical protein
MVIMKALWSSRSRSPSANTALGEERIEILRLSVRGQDERAPGVAPAEHLNQSGTDHLQITCSGAAISASVDGQQTASIQDSTYPVGLAFLRVGISRFTGAL